MRDGLGRHKDGAGEWCVRIQINIIAMDAAQIQRLPVRLILVVLIIVEVTLIASRYSIGFDEYITIVIILLALPLAYFAFHYLRNAYREARDEELFSKQAYRRVVGVGIETDEALRRLVDNPAFLEFERRKMGKGKGQEESHEETEEERLNREDEELFLAELEDKETEIFQP